MNRTPKFEKREYSEFYLPSDDMDVNILCHKVKLVKVRKDSRCSYCGTKISKGDFAQSESGFFDDWDKTPFYIHNCLDCVEEEMEADYSLDREEVYKRWEQRAKESGFVK